MNCLLLNQVKVHCAITLNNVELQLSVNHWGTIDE